MFQSPGRADTLEPALLKVWNDTIQTNFDAQADSQSRFFVLDPADLTAPQQVEIAWPGDPAEPGFCIDDTAARLLSDWGKKGRHLLQDEYCEYAVQFRRDRTGALRPKRVEVTTELREYWVMIATHNPVRVRAMATEVLGFEPSWPDLYGVADPLALSEADRQLAFCHAVAGNGRDKALEEAGVPAQPTGSLNTDHALFMTHPINGLDDLLGIVMFGARPYAKKTGHKFARASRDEIFSTFNDEVLACRHADPTAAMGAYAAAFVGKTVAFADPVGIYLRPAPEDIFSFNGQPLPKEWIAYSRGGEGMHQRLDFGPPDDLDDVFLDDIVVSVGASDQPLTGGYQIVQHLEVGPLVAVGTGEAVRDDEWRVVKPRTSPITCSSSKACADIRQLQRQFEMEHPSPVAPRRRRIL